MSRAYVYTEREAGCGAADAGQEGGRYRQGVRCPMPGLVVSIAVVEGQEVKAGETLAVVEAMKMENVLRAERDGTVQKIRAKQATAWRWTPLSWSSRSVILASGGSSQPRQCNVASHRPFGVAALKFVGQVRAALAAIRVCPLAGKH